MRGNIHIYEHEVSAMSTSNNIPPDLSPVRLERPCTISAFKIERHLAEHVWDFCRKNGCKPGQYFRLLVEKDLRLAASDTTKAQ